MKAISKLKDDARRHELKEEWEKAIQSYLNALRAGEDGEGELELPLYNRVGDLYLRLGRPNDAVTYYEQAADRYAESGLYNNAIALCNKAMRYRPDSLELLRKLGEFSASQGFLIDARRYFLEYAEKQFAAGSADEAISALKNFADVSDDPEILELLGKRLAARGRKADALEELRKAHRLYVNEGQDDRATAVLAEIRGIDPDAGAEGSAAAAEAGVSPPEDEILDVGDELPQLADFDFALDSPVPAASETGANASVESPPDVLDDMELTDFGSGLEFTDELMEPATDGLAEAGTEDAAAEPAAEPSDGMRDDVAGDVSDTPADEFALLDGMEITGFSSDPVPQGPVDVIEGLESTALDFGDVAFDLEATDLGLELERDESSFGAADVDSLDTSRAPAEEVEGALDLPSYWDEDEPPSFADEDATDTAESAFDLPTLDDAADDEPDPVAFPLPMLDEDATTDPSAPFELPALDDDGADDMVFELPTLAEDDSRSGSDGDVQASPVELHAPEEQVDGEPATFEPTDGVADGGVEDAVDSASVDSASVEEAVAEDAVDATGADEEDDWPGPPEWVGSTVGDEPGAAGDVGEGAGWDLAWDGAVADPATPEEEGPALEHTDTGLVPPAPLLPTPERAFEQLAEPVPEPVAGEDQELPGDTGVAEPEDAPWDELRTAGEVLAGDGAAEAPAAPVDLGWTPVDLEPAVEEKTPEPDPSPAAGSPVDEGFVDLGAMLSDEVEETTRFKVREKAPTGDEDRDFAELLNQFKEKVSAHVPAEDAAAHYDLGLAFKDMGLVDEAITEFQIALRTGPMRLKVYEELGDCFLQKGQFNIAEKVLRRALDARPDDEHDLLGVYYHLGRAYEELGRRDDARDAFERVLGMDINFRDVSQRLSRL